MSQGLASFGKETPTGPVMLRRILHEAKELQKIEKISRNKISVSLAAP
jgi:hypothetical protein